MINVLDFIKYEKISEYEASLKEEINYLETQIKNLPKGRLTVCRNGNYHQYYIRTKDKRTISLFEAKGYNVKYEWIDKNGDKGIVAHLPKKEHNLAVKFAKREKIEEELSILLKADSWLIHYMSKIKKGIEKYRKFLAEASKAQLIESEEFERREKLTLWANDEFKSNELYKDRLKYKTKMGKYVRSKSEVMIADALTDNRLPFRYEQEVCVNGNKHHPDFLIVHPATAKVYIWEHNGMMDRPSYIRKAASCLEDYSIEGFLLDDDLIFTSETEEQPLRLEDVEKKIRHILFDDGKHNNNERKCIKE